MADDIRDIFELRARRIVHEMVPFDPNPGRALLTRHAWPGRM